MACMACQAVASINMMQRARQAAEQRTTASMKRPTCKSCNPNWLAQSQAVTRRLLPEEPTE